MQKKYLITILILIVSLIAVFFLLEATGKINFFTGNSSSSTTDGNINYSPPTEEEIKAGNIAKENTANSPTSNDDAGLEQPNGPKEKVDVIITDANQYDEIIEVRSFIPNHYQDGTCTIRFSKDDYTITKQVPAYKDATTTICTNPLINRSEFIVNGTWQVSVAYDSTNAEGLSTTKSIEIK